MLGKRPPQPQLFDVGHVYDLRLPTRSFHAQLAQAAARLFRDEDFERLYAKTQARPSGPPSLLALTLLLQQHAGVSDLEAIERTAYDLRWNAGLGRTDGTPLCAKSTLQLFRAHLILHEQARQIFVKSLDQAKRAGRLQTSLRVAIDTRPILGRGAVEDTFNRLDTGIRQLARAFAEAAIPLEAKVAKEVEPQGRFAKSAFCIDLSASTVTCPAGHTIGEGVVVPSRGLQYRLGRLCRECPLRHRCSSSRSGRTLTVPPQEALLPEARAYQQSSEGKAHLRQRVAIEHALARLSGLGIGQARYCGRVKTGFQLLLAATVANLGWTWNWTAHTGPAGLTGGGPGLFSRMRAAFLSPLWRRSFPRLGGFHLVTLES